MGGDTSSQVWELRRYEPMVVIWMSLSSLLAASGTIFKRTSTCSYGESPYCFKAAPRAYVV